MGRINRESVDRPIAGRGRERGFVTDPMADLQKLLNAAAKAGKQDRITWRDRIVEHGALAVPATRGWLTDAELGAFAVRVLARIAERPDDRAAALEALASVHPSEVSAPVARDIAEARERLTGRKVPKSTGGRARTAPKDWPGLLTASPLERRFHEAMLDIFKLAGEATRKERPDGTKIRGYWASYFLRGVRNHGGPAYAHQLLETEGTTDGFTRLQDEGRLDLTMEALVLRPEFEALFSESERQVAASRLAAAGDG